MVEFEVLSDDPKVIELVKKYWTTDDNGKYLHNVADLLPFRGITTIPKLIDFINGESAAWNPDNPCPICQSSVFVRSRTDPAVRKLYKPELCHYCQEQQAMEKAQHETKERERLSLAIRNSSESARKREIEYGQLRDDIALILLALERTISPKLIGGSFEANDLRFLISGSVISFLKRLIDAGAIASDAAIAPPGAYWLKGDDLWFSMEKTRYFLVPDKTYGASEDALEYLNNRPWDQNDQLRMLWLDYATAECMTYFFDQCSQYSLSPISDDVEKITSQIRVALDQYCIQELWCALWTVVKDAAALSKREYYNVAKATSTMPGKLHRLLEAVRKGQRIPLKAWDRPHYQPAGTLGDIFFERYGLNEGTPGALVKRIFTSPTPPAYDPFMECEIVKKGLVDVLVERIHHHGLGAMSLSIFAAGIREGMSIEEAIATLINKLPSLQEGMDEAG